MIEKNNDELNYKQAQIAYQDAVIKADAERARIWNDLFTVPATEYEKVFYNPILLEKYEVCNKDSEKYSTIKCEIVTEELKDARIAKHIYFEKLHFDASIEADRAYDKIRLPALDFWKEAVRNYNKSLI